MTDIASLGIRIDTHDIATANRALGDLARQGGATERVTDSLVSATSRLGSTTATATQQSSNLISQQQRLSRGASEASQETESLTSALISQSGAIAATAASFAALHAGISRALKESMAYEAALMGVAAAANDAGSGIDKTLNAALELSKDGWLSVTEAALGLKNLLSSGFSLEEAIKAIRTIEDAAVYGKQAHLEFGQAVVSTTEGIKNMNSAITDNAGMTENMGAAMLRYAHSIGKTVEQMSAQEVVLAKLAWLEREGEQSKGNLVRASDSLSHSLAQTNKALEEAYRIMGQELTPATQALAELWRWFIETEITPMIRGLKAVGIEAAHVSTVIGSIFSGEWTFDKAKEWAKIKNEMLSGLSKDDPAKAKALSIPVKGGLTGAEREELDGIEKQLEAIGKESDKIQKELDHAEKDLETRAAKIDAMETKMAKQTAKSVLSARKEVSHEAERAAREQKRLLAEEERAWGKLSATIFRLNDEKIARDEADRQRLMNQIQLEANAALEYARILRDRLALESDWRAGAIVGLEDYSRESANVFQQTENLTKKAFKGMEDAMVRFAKTGKFSFKEMTDSIVEDMMRMQIRQSITGPLASLVGGLFGGESGSDVQTVPPGMGDPGPLPGWLGKKASGVDNVPHDGFAFLHKGEAVVTAAENKGGIRNGMTINQPVTINVNGGGGASAAEEIRRVLPAMLMENNRVIEGIVIQASRRNGGRLPA